MNATSSGHIANGRTAVIEVSVEIAREPESVFTYCSDHRNEIEWNPQMCAVTKLGDGPVGPGTRYEMVFPTSRRPVISECVEWRYPTAWKLTGTAIGMETSFSGHVTPAPLGARLQIRMELSAAGLRRLVLPLVLWQMRRSLDRDILLIKERLESPASRMPRE